MVGLIFAGLAGAGGGTISPTSPLNFACNTFGWASIVLGKLSFATTLLRIVGPKVKYFVWFVIVTTGVTGAAQIPWVYFRCSPTEKLWNPALPGTCGSFDVFTKYTIFCSGMFCLSIILKTGSESDILAQL
jgi:hypothetical protein